MKNLLIALIFEIPVIAFNQNQNQNKADSPKSFSGLLNNYWEERMKFSP